MVKIFIRSSEIVMDININHQTDTLRSTLRTYSHKVKVGVKAKMIKEQTTNIKGNFNFRLCEHSLKSALKR